MLYIYWFGVITTVYKCDISVNSGGEITSNIVIVLLLLHLSYMKSCLFHRTMLLVVLLIQSIPSHTVWLRCLFWFGDKQSCVTISKLLKMDTVNFGFLEILLTAAHKINCVYCGFMINQTFALLLCKITQIEEPNFKHILWPHHGNDVDCY